MDRPSGPQAHSHGLAHIPPQLCHLPWPPLATASLPVSHRLPPPHRRSPTACRRCSPPPHHRPPSQEAGLLSSILPVVDMPITTAASLYSSPWPDVVPPPPLHCKPGMPPLPSTILHHYRHLLPQPTGPSLPCPCRMLPSSSSPPNGAVGLPLRHRLTEPPLRSSSFESPLKPPIAAFSCSLPQPPFADPPHLLPISRRPSSHLLPINRHLSIASPRSYQRCRPLPEMPAIATMPPMLIFLPEMLTPHVAMMLPPSLHHHCPKPLLAAPPLLSVLSSLHRPLSVPKPLCHCLPHLTATSHLLPFALSANLLFHHTTATFLPSLAVSPRSIIAATHACHLIANLFLLLCPHDPPLFPSSL